MLKQETLSKNQQIVLDYIEKVNEPIKAYSILHNVQKKGIKAPLQVYRALDKLVEIGKIHKIESRNAFVACKNSNCQISKATAFSICESFHILKMPLPLKSDNLNFCMQRKHFYFQFCEFFQFQPIYQALDKPEEGL